ncbi:MAG: hypothetical protein PHE77_02695 [Candidatus Pacebacteria bacterium]|nr:hypothetical protein [Candidatus Paceibacterota bacterium]
MANIIALIIFIGSFAGLAFLVFKKMVVLANIPEEVIQNQNSKLLNRAKLSFSKQEIYKKLILLGKQFYVIGECKLSWQKPLIGLELFLPIE